jgi:molybdenum cofactor cytidylyltransferase
VKVAAIILAAGASTRMGQPKQALNLGGERLLERAVRVAEQAGCVPVVVVLGASAEMILAECSLDHATVVMNPEWREGMASSIRCGVRRVAGECDAALLMVCDQPAVTADHLRKLVDRCTDRCIGGPVASSYGGRLGVPACFPASHFGELLLLHGDSGAKHLLESTPGIDLAGGELDIDTPLTLETAKAIYR